MGEVMEYRSYYFLFLVLIILHVKCAEPKVIFKPDHSLLKFGWSPELQEKYPKSSFIARFNKNRKKLSYIAAFHVTNLKNDTINNIKNEFASLLPQIIIVEGIPSENGISPADIVTQFKNMKKIENERSFTIRLALQTNIPFIGAEPSFKFEKAYFLNNSYDARDIANFYIIRQIGQWRRESSKPNYKKLVSKFSKHLKQILTLDNEELPTFEKVKKWYEEKNQRAFDIKFIIEESTIPLNSDNALFTQRLAALSMKIRDANIVNTIADMLNKYDRVLVVYGLSHYRMQAKVLEKMFNSVPELILNKY
jgi:hypothetical protein